MCLSLYFAATLHWFFKAVINSAGTLPWFFKAKAVIDGDSDNGRTFSPEYDHLFCVWVPNKSYDLVMAYLSALILSSWIEPILVTLKDFLAFFSRRIEYDYVAFAQPSYFKPTQYSYLCFIKWGNCWSCAWSKNVLRHPDELPASSRMWHKIGLWDHLYWVKVCIVIHTTEDINLCL